MSAWDEAVEGRPVVGSTEWAAAQERRRRVLLRALLHACRDVIRLETEAGDPDAATNLPGDVAEGYIEEAERRLELEAQRGLER
jgi:hypothetical protein